MATLSDILTALQNGVIAVNNLSKVTNTVRTGLYAFPTLVANLPAAASSQGLIFLVTDANATTRLSTVAGGGANVVLVFSDGSAWKIV